MSKTGKSILYVAGSAVEASVSFLSRGLNGDVGAAEEEDEESDDDDVVWEDLPLHHAEMEEVIERRKQLAGFWTLDDSELTRTPPIVMSEELVAESDSSQLRALIRQQ